MKPELRSTNSEKATGGKVEVKIEKLDGKHNYNKIALAVKTVAEEISLQGGDGIYCICHPLTMIDLGLIAKECLPQKAAWAIITEGTLAGYEISTDGRIKENAIGVLSSQWDLHQEERLTGKVILED